MENQIISLSGGKDSTAMFLMMLERKEKFHSVIAFDTGWEFPQMQEHINLLEQRTGIKIWRLHPKLPFDYWLYARPVIAKKGKCKGEVHQFGYGWPSPSRRWCTRLKVSTLDAYLGPIEGAISCVGFAADEVNRGTPNSKTPCRMPLQNWGVTEKDALQYCYDKGYDWGGLYKYFGRVSCYCCPLQPLPELRTLKRQFPELWNKMLKMEDQISKIKWFKGYKTVHDFERRFTKEEQIKKRFFSSKRVLIDNSKM